MSVRKSLARNNLIQRLAKFLKLIKRSEVFKVSFRPETAKLTAPF
jgi:hypothetical protein